MSNRCASLRLCVGNEANGLPGPWLTRPLVTMRVSVCVCACVCLCFPLSLSPSILSSLHQSSTLLISLLPSHPPQSLSLSSLCPSIHPSLTVYHCSIHPYLSLSSLYPLLPPRRSTKLRGISDDRSPEIYSTSFVGTNVQVKQCCQS